MDAACLSTASQMAGIVLGIDCVGSSVESAIA